MDPTGEFGGVPPPPLLRVEGLRVEFPSAATSVWRRGEVQVAVDRTSFEVARGTTLGLVGESGSGKTTLALAIVGLVRPHAGRILLDGVDVFRAHKSRLRALRRRMQIVFQDSSGCLNPRRTVGQAIAEPLEIHRVGNASQRRARVIELLARVGLDASGALCYPHELSGGQRQRVGIARALTLSPDLLICDEPVSALDVSVQAQILNLLTELKADLELSMFFITHNLAVAEHVSDRMAVMYAGRIVELAPAKEPARRYGHPYTRELMSAVLHPSVAEASARLEARGTNGTGVRATVLPSRGCAFHPRCRFSTEECREKNPSLRPLGAPATDHLVACHHAEAVVENQPISDAPAPEEAGPIPSAAPL